MLELLMRWLMRFLPPTGEVGQDETSASVDRTEASAEVRRLVWSGFEPESAIAEIVIDGYPAPEALSEFDRRWIAAEVERQFADKRQAEEAWPAKTDWDRLDAAFVQLRASGIIALHDAGLTQSDGFADIAEEYRMRQEVGVVSSGFVFYGGEDIDAALSDGELYMAFGAFDKRTENTPAVAAEIIAVLGKRGLQAHWSGDIGKRMVVRPLEWRKRSPAD